ncbi:MAG TPA: hypothetical protein VGM99_05405 [Candidatus Cybelea sp.]
MTETVRILFTDGTTDDIAEVEDHTTVTAANVGGRVVVSGQRRGSEAPTEIRSYPAEDVKAVVVKDQQVWSEGGHKQA